MALPVHLENGQRVYFQSGEAPRVLASGPPATQLTAWFQHNKDHADVPVEQQLLYSEFPAHYTFDGKTKTWNQRKRSQGEFPTVGRVHSVHPSVGDLFYLRTLLHRPHARGKKSFADLRTVMNVEQETFKAACRQIGLLQDDAQWDDAMQDAALTQLCPQMRKFFILILEFNDTADPSALFERHWRSMADDFQYRAEQAIPDDILRTMVLIDLERLAQTRSKRLSDYKLPAIDEASRASAEQIDERARVYHLPQLIQEELSYDKEEQQAAADRSCAGMLETQRAMVDAVLKAVEETTPYAVFVDAPGGTGKTYCFNAILCAVRAKGQAALAVASSGIAATLLEGGRTFHSRFKVPVNINDKSTCSISAQSPLAKLIRKAPIIIWDEAPMGHRHWMEALDRSMRDITQVNLPFGGKVVVLGGDFRQVLPVVKRGSRAQIVEASLQRSPLWQHFHIFRLKENVRVRLGGTSPEAEDYAQWLLDLGEGKLPTDPEDDTIIELPKEQCIGPDLAQLIDWTFPDMDGQHLDASWMAERVILAARNADVDEINNAVTDRFPGEDIVCASADAVTDSGSLLDVPVEYLNTLHVSGLPSHELRLKRGMPIILLRNLSQGLCNGTRLLVERVINGRVLEARFPLSGEKVLIPRVGLCPSDEDFPFKWKRLQFPVRPAFAMTINKAQGQSIKRVGVDLRNPVFTHGQLYVAASRVSHPSNICFVVNDRESCKTVNIVFLRSTNDLADSLFHLIATRAVKIVLLRVYAFV